MGPAAVEPAATMKPSASPEVAADRPTSAYAAGSESAPAREAGSPDEAAFTSNKRPKTRPPDQPMSPERAKARAAEESVSAKPRARANKDAAGKPARSVVAIGRARVGVISVITVGAHRSRTNITRAANSYANHDSLCVCIGSATKRNAEHRENFQISHGKILSESRKTRLIDSCYPLHLWTLSLLGNAQGLPNPGPSGMTLNSCIFNTMHR